MFFLLRIALATRDLLYFHLSFNIFAVSLKNEAGILMRIELDLILVV